jgi:hypothetical protein
VRLPRAPSGLSEGQGRAELNGAGIKGRATWLECRDVWPFVRVVSFLGDLYLLPMSR